MKLKKVLALVLAMVMTIALVACGNMWTLVRPLAEK